MSGEKNKLNKTKRNKMLRNIMLALFKERVDDEREARDAWCQQMAIDAEPEFRKLYDDPALRPFLLFQDYSEIKFDVDSGVDGVVGAHADKFLSFTKPKIIEYASGSIEEIKLNSIYSRFDSCKDRPETIQVLAHKRVIDVVLNNDDPNCDRYIQFVNSGDTLQKDFDDTKDMLRAALASCKTVVEFNESYASFAHLHGEPEFLSTTAKLPVISSTSIVDELNKRGVKIPPSVKDGD